METDNSKSAQRVCARSTMLDEVATETSATFFSHLRTKEMLDDVEDDV